MPAVEYGPLLDSVRGVRWPARRTIPGVVTGSHHSRLRGISPEFTEYRAYRQGDDPRRIDWRLFGRSDRTSIRLSDDRAVLPTMVVVDASASMAFPERSLGKWRQASALAIALAAVAYGQFDPVGLIVAGDTPVVLPPRARRGTVSEIASALAASRPRDSAPLEDGLVQARRVGCQRVAVISDFLSQERETIRAARQIVVAGGEVHAVHIVATEELEPPRDVLAFDPENAIVVRPLTEATRAAYVRAFAAWRERLADSWRGAGAFYVLATTAEEPARITRRIASATETA